MKKTQIIELFRNMKNTIATFLSIGIIVALGIAVYLGINFAAEGLRKTNSERYQQESYRDLEVVSALGIVEDDLEALRKQEYIELAVGSYAVNGTAILGKSGKKPVRIIGKTTGVNEGTIKEGRAAETSEECVAEQRWAQQNGVKAGDAIQLQTSGKGQYLNNKTFKVTGLISYIGSSKNKGTVIVEQEVLNPKAFQDCYTSAYIVLKDSKGMPIYSEEYEALVDDAQKKIQKICDERADLRYETLKQEAEQQYANAQSKLQEARTGLDDAKIKLSQAQEAIQAGEKKNAAGEKELLKAEEQIKDGEVKLRDGEEKLSKAEIKINNGWQKLSAAAVQLQEGRNKLDEGHAQLEAASIELQAQQSMGKTKLSETVREVMIPTEQAQPNTDAPADANVNAPVNLDADVDRMVQNVWDYIEANEQAGTTEVVDYILDMNAVADPEVRSKVHMETQGSAYDQMLTENQQAKQKIKEAADQLQAGEELYAEKLAEYEAGLAEYNAGLAQYEEGCAQYSQNEAKLNDGKSRYQAGVQELADGKEMLAQKKAEYEQKEAEYEAGEKSYAKKLKKLERQKKKIDAMEPAGQILLERSAITSYETLKANAQNLESLGLTLALTFILVAAMVCYTSISRMVEEHRILLGVQKAQGFFAREIFMRYLCYAVVSTSLGVIGGVAAGYFIIQKMLLDVYKFIDHFERMLFVFSSLIAAAVACAVMVISCLAVWLACQKLLKTPATTLMREEVPKGTGNFFSRFFWWKKLPLFTRVIIGNICSDKRRVITTIAGVAGCTTLLVTGFSVKMSADKLPELQYGTIQKYDMVLTVESSITSEERETVQEALVKEGCQSISVAAKTITYRAGDHLSAASLTVAQKDELKGYIELTDAVTGKEQVVPEDGVLISQGMADAYGMKAGDKLQTLDARGNPYSLNIKGVFVNYIGQKIITSSSYYTAVYGKELKENQYYIHQKGANRNTLKETILPLVGVKSLENADAGRTQFNQLSGTLNSILILLIALAAIMAVMILFNLAVMHIRQKSKELAVMRVNGFTLKETKRYVQREAVVITAVGILAGILLGSLLSQQIRVMLQSAVLQMEGGVKPTAWLIAAGITAVFSLVVNGIAMMKIKKLSLTHM